MNKNREDMLRKVMGTENYDLDMEIKRLRLKDTEDAADRLIEIMNNYPGWIGFEAARTLIKKKAKK